MFFNAKTTPAFDHDTTIKVVIFSKDRSCQLDVLLNSMKDNFRYHSVDCTVLFTTSSDLFAEAYERLRKMHSETIHWFRESSFKSDLKNIILTIPDRTPVMFLVDDDIFFRPLTIGSLISKFTESHLFISLRTDKRYKRYKNPRFRIDSNIIEWNWKYYRNSLSTWHYPFSVDGNIFNSTVIKRILYEIDFKAPNSLEAAMHEYRKQKWIQNINRAIAPDQAVIFNNPMNKIQLEGETWNQNISADYLNDAFLKGYRIEYQKLYTCVPTGIHTAVEVTFSRSFNTVNTVNVVDHSEDEKKELSFT